MEKVNSMRSGGIQFSNVPKEVLRDLDLAKLFNGTYTHKVEEVFSTKYRTLSICYDGSSWTFGYRLITTSNILGVPPTMKKSKVTLKHDEIVGATYPLYDIKELVKTVYDMTVDGAREAVDGDSEVITLPNNLYMKTKIQVSLQDQDWNVGRVLFVGSHFKFIWRINVDVNGSKYLSHHGVIQIETMKLYHDFLLNSMRFDEDEEQIVIEVPTEELKEMKIDEDIEINEYKFFDPEKYFQWEVITEGALNDFWKIVEDEE